MSYYEPWFLPVTSLASTLLDRPPAPFRVWDTIKFALLMLDPSTLGLFIFFPR